VRSARGEGAPEALAWLGASPATTALLTDFDGTLSAVVARPPDARPLPGAVLTLKRLAKRLMVVAVVSGREAEWLVGQLDLGDPPAADGGGSVRVYGLHGLQRTKGGTIELEPAVVEWAEPLAEAARLARAEGLVGVEVEDKGFGVTLHWRNAPDLAAAEAQAVACAKRIASELRLSSRLGRASIELVAPVGIDKGTIVQRFGDGDGPRRVAFIGDDVSDLLAFAAIDSLTAAGLEGLKIAVGSSEAPPSLLDSADVILAGPEAAVRLLTDLADALDESPLA